MRTIQKDKGSRKKTKYFCGKRSRNGNYRQLQKRLTKSKVYGDEVSYTYRLSIEILIPTELMNYVLFIGLTNVKSEISKLKAVIKKNPCKKPNLNMCL